ncbi:MAG: hypothetical protein ABDH63_07725, partial [Candidatus Caldarchaeales archaeon]
NLTKRIERESHSLATSTSSELNLTKRIERRSRSAIGKSVSPLRTSRRGLKGGHSSFASRFYLMPNLTKRIESEMSEGTPFST